MDYISLIKEKNQKVEINYQNNLKKIRAFGAHPSLLEDVNVNYYGSLTPLNQISSIKIQDSTTLLISPFDKSIVKDIIHAISKANLGLTANDDGNSIRIIVPQLTEEKRKEFAKKAKTISEEAKISLRNVRQDINKKIQSDSELSEDEKKNQTNLVQKEIDLFSKEIENILKEKIDALMKV